LSRAAFEALALAAYRERKISAAQLRQLLGYATRMEVDAFLKSHGVELEYTLKDIEGIATPTGNSACRCKRSYADTTPLNYLVLIQAADILPNLYRTVLIPPAIHSKVRAWISTKPNGSAKGRIMPALFARFFPPGPNSSLRLMSCRGASASEVVKRVSDETPNASAAAWMYLAHPSFELPCWHCFQRADIAFNLISNLIFGDFQVIARLEIHPERRTIVEVARETQGCVSSNCAFLVDDIGDPRHRDAQVHSNSVHT